MAHMRQQIREAAAQAVTGLVTTGSNVFESRVYRLDPTELPALAVYTTLEVSTRDDMDDNLARTLDLEVEGYAKANLDVDDTLDQMAEEIEVALGADPTLGGLADDMVLTGSVSQLNGEADKVVGVVTMTYTVEYRTTTTDPTVAT